MKTETNRGVEYYRNLLSDTIVSKDSKVEFTFISRRQERPELWILEEDNDIGKVIIRNVKNGEVYNARYELQELHGRFILEIKFDDFKVVFNKMFLSGSQGAIKGNFEEILKHLIEEFPQFPTR